MQWFWTTLDFAGARTVGGMANERVIEGSGVAGGATVAAARACLEALRALTAGLADDADLAAEDGGDSGERREGVVLSAFGAGDGGLRQPGFFRYGFLCPGRLRGEPRLLQPEGD